MFFIFFYSWFIMTKLSAIEKHVIKYVTDLRIDKELTRADIATILDVGQSFIAKVENENERAKYNLNHIDKLADHFGLSPKDFLPEKANKHI